MTPEQEKALNKLALGYLEPYQHGLRKPNWEFIALAQVVLELTDRMNGVEAHPALSIPALDRDGGADQHGRPCRHDPLGQRPLCRECYPEKADERYGAHEAEIGTCGDRRPATPEGSDFAEVDEQRDEGEYLRERVNEHQVRNSEPQSRARVRDELAGIVARKFIEGRSSAYTVDLILDRLMREPSETSGFTRNYANGEWSRRNIEAFLDDVKSGKL